MINLSKNILLKKSNIYRVKKLFPVSRKIFKQIKCRFSVYESSFVKSVDSQLSKNKSDLLEHDRKEFEVKLMDDPIYFFDILKKSIISIRINKDLKELKIFLEYICIIMKYFLLYENSKLIFGLYIEVVDEFFNMLINYYNLFSIEFQNHIVKFLREDLGKMENNDNIFVLYFLYSYLKRKVNSIWSIVLLDNFIQNNSKGIEIARQISLTNPSSSSQTDHIFELLLNSIKDIFKDISSISRKSYNENYILSFSATKPVSCPLVIGIFIDLMVVYQIFINTHKINPHKYENLLFSLDYAISEYLISSSCPLEILYYCGDVLAYVKNLTNRILILPYIFNNLCRVFIAKNGMANIIYLKFHINFLRNIFKESYSVTSVHEMFRTNLFYINSFMCDHKNSEKIPTKILIEIFYFLTVSKFKVEEKMIREIDKRFELINEIPYNEVVILVTSYAMTNYPNFKIFHNVMKCIKNYSFTLKKFLNLGFYFALAKYDNYENWETWFKCLNQMNLRLLNRLDKKMLNDIINYLRLLGPEYKKFKIYDGMTLEDVKAEKLNDSIPRWFHSNNVKQSLSEVTIQKFFTSHFKDVKTQFIHEDSFIDADFLIGEDVVVEILGPSHYFINSNFQMDVKTKMKQEVWQSLGYHCLFLNAYLLPSSDKIGYGVLLKNIQESLPKEVYERIKK